MPEDKIISSFFGGIGDNLQFSTLPRRFTELGHKVYLSDKCAFRNPEIQTLCWLDNPYILGETDQPSNCGDAHGLVIRHSEHGFLYDWEVAHNLPAPYSKYPEIYYVPKTIKEVENNILLDVTGTSATIQGVYDSIRLAHFLKEHYAKECITVCLFQEGISHPILLLDGYDMIFVKDIFHYTDLIFSCKKFVCLHSGGMVLTSALKRQKNIDCDCLVTLHPIHVNGFNNKHHFYDNINYIWI